MAGMPRNLFPKTLGLQAADVVAVRQVFLVTVLVVAVNEELPVNVLSRPVAGGCGEGEFDSEVVLAGSTNISSCSSVSECASGKGICSGSTLSCGTVLTGVPVVGDSCGW